MTDDAMAKPDTFMAAIAARPAPVAEPPRATLCSRFADKGSMRGADLLSNAEGTPWWYVFRVVVGRLEFGFVASGANAEAAKQKRVGTRGFLISSHSASSGSLFITARAPQT